MKIRQPHSWDLRATEAVALQRKLANQIDTRTPLADCDLIAGADISYNRVTPVFYAAVVVLRADDWTIVESQTAVRTTPFPYVPGLLSFREAPAYLETFEKLTTRPDVVMFDGAGFAHPRRFGLACHVGWCLDIPSLGCAKSVLVGKSREPGKSRGSITLLKDGDEVIGSVVRTQTGIKPVYVSVGHKIDLASAVRLVLRSSLRYRLPEPTRQAHLCVNALRRGAKG